MSESVNGFTAVPGQMCTLRNGQRVLLRPAVPADGPATLTLSQAVWSERIYHVTEESTITPEEQAFFIAGLDGRSLFLVAEILAPETGAGTLIGILFAKPYMQGMSPKVAHVLEMGMSVAPGWRSLGLGLALVTFLDWWARVAGYEKIVLSVFATNTAALRLYTSTGFHEEGRRIGQFRVEGQYVDEVLMGKFL